MIKLQDILTKVQLDCNNISGRFDINDIISFSNDFVNMMRRDHLLPWTKKTGSLHLFNDVIEYPVFGDLSDFYDPQKPYPGKDDSYFIDVTQPELARGEGKYNQIALDYKSGSKIAAIRYNTGQSDTIIDDLSSITNWSLTGDAANLSVDTLHKRIGSSSLSFDCSGANPITLTNTHLSLDLSAILNKGYQFLYIYLPVAGLTSVGIKIGTDVSNYYTLTATAQFDGSAFVTGWNLIGIDTFNATQVGSVALSHITYVQITLTGCGVATGYLINGLIMRNWVELTLPYYSKYNFLASDGIAYKEFATVGDDSILGDNEYDDCCRYYNSWKIARYKIKDADLVKLIQEDMDDSLKALYKNHPDLRRKIQTDWYPMNHGYGRRINRDKLC